GSGRPGAGVDKNRRHSTTKPRRFLGEWCTFKDRQLQGRSKIGSGVASTAEQRVVKENAKAYERATESHHHRRRIWRPMRSAHAWVSAGRRDPHRPAQLSPFSASVVSGCYGFAFPR